MWFPYNTPVFLLGGQMRQEGVDLRLGHILGMADVVEVDEPLDPVDVGLFSSAAVVTGTQGVLHLVERPGFAAIHVHAPLDPWGVVSQNVHGTRLRRDGAFLVEAACPRHG